MAMDPTDQEDAWQMRYANILEGFGIALYDLHHTNPWPERPALNLAISDIACDLWKRGFSETEIRAAYEFALAGLPNYTAGQDKRF